MRNSICIKNHWSAVRLQFLIYLVVWQTFNEIQKLLSKTNGKVVGDLMTPTPLVVHEWTNLEDAARYLFCIQIKPSIPLIHTFFVTQVILTLYFLPIYRMMITLPVIFFYKIRAAFDYGI